MNYTMETIDDFKIIIPLVYIDENWLKNNVNSEHVCFHGRNFGKENYGFFQSPPKSFGEKIRKRIEWNLKSFSIDWNIFVLILFVFWIFSEFHNFYE